MVRATATGDKRLVLILIGCRCLSGQDRRPWLADNLLMSMSGFGQAI